jgi:ankyrin repeat protein
MYVQDLILDFENCISHSVLLGADVNQMKRSDWTPLMLASTKLGSMALQTVHVLLNHKADPHIMNKDGWTALHVACKIGHCGTVKLLLERFPNMANIQSTNGRYPIHTACKCCTVPFTHFSSFIRKLWLTVSASAHVLVWGVHFVANNL